MSHRADDDNRLVSLSDALLDLAERFPQLHPTEGEHGMSSRSERAHERRLEAVARGMDTAQKAIRAFADYEDDRALAILNTTAHEDAIWASAYLLSCLREMATVLAKGDPKEASRLLHVGADGAAEDTALTQVGVIINNAFEGGQNHG